MVKAHFSFLKTWVSYKKNINILLADDDKDNMFFFSRALEKIAIPSKIVSIEDGEMLLSYLGKKTDNLPDILFLDVNMPRKNGMECLTEIKANKQLKDFPVIIYSTSLNESAADAFYEKGAHYYIKKCDLDELIIYLEFVLNKFKNNDLVREAKDKFILNLPIAQ